MRILVTQMNQDLTLTAELTPGDREVAGKASLARQSATFKMPSGYTWTNTHPDLIALASLIAFYPWIGRELITTFPVSSGFAETVLAKTKITVPNSSDDVLKRVTDHKAHPGLSFSAGVDSMAALALMPEDTVPVFSLRSPPPNGAGSLYKADVALHAISEMANAGKTVHVVESDHEWLRDPVGFTVDPAPAVPLILLADKLNLDAITFGTIAESAYMTGKGKWVEYMDRIVYTRWRDLFQAVGLASYNATAGVSEIGTSTIVQSSRFGYLAQSCIRGIPGHPCRACVKCFRKSLITASLTGRWPERDEVSRMMAHRTIMKSLEPAEIHFEIILTAAMSGYDGSDPLLLALQERVGSNHIDVSFTHGWYPPAMELIPEKYREFTVKAVSSFLPAMTADQMEMFQSFNVAELVDAARDSLDVFRASLIQNASPSVEA